jgi:hypothetical protein
MNYRLDGQTYDTIDAEAWRLALLTVKRDSVGSELLAVLDRIDHLVDELEIELTNSKQVDKILQGVANGRK